MSIDYFKLAYVYLATVVEQQKYLFIPSTEAAVQYNHIRLHRAFK